MFKKVWNSTARAALESHTQLHPKVSPKFKNDEDHEYQHGMHRAIQSRRRAGCSFTWGD